MNAQVLVSDNPQLRTEFANYAAVANTNVEVWSGAADERQFVAVFVDLEWLNTNPGIQLPAALATYLVHTGEAGPPAWNAAMHINATAILALPRDRQQVLELLTVKPQKLAHILVVQPAVGGSGASTLAAAVAARLALSARTVLVDLDLGGGGIDVLCGIEHSSGTRWPDLIGSSFPSFESLPQTDGLAVLSAGREPAQIDVTPVVAHLAAQCEWLVLDAPRAGWKAAADFRIVVAPASVRAALTLAPTIAELRATDSVSGLVLRTGGALALEPIPLADSLGIELLATIPNDNRIAEHIERGLGADRIALGGYARAVRTVTDQLMQRCD